MALQRGTPSGKSSPGPYALLAEPVRRPEPVFAEAISPVEPLPNAAPQPESYLVEAEVVWEPLVFPDAVLRLERSAEQALRNLRSSPIVRLSTRPEPAVELVVAYAPATPLAPPLPAPDESAQLAPDLPARIVGANVVEYPRLARRLGEQGSVLLEIEVDGWGRPRAIRVLDSSGFPRLDEAAVEAARSWSYAPATQAGVAVTGRLEHRVTFALDERS
jgi:protein TonB